MENTFNVVSLSRHALERRKSPGKMKTDSDRSKGMIHAHDDRTMFATARNELCCVFQMAFNLVDRLQGPA
jgi:hypothetical protein